MKIYGIPVATPIDPDIVSVPSAINFDLENERITETINGEEIIHDVTFDDEGRPIKIDNIDIAWG